MSDCNTPAQLPCGAGPFQSPACYTVPPSTLLQQGFLSVTLNPDCSLASSQILDTTFTPVVGAVQAPCDPLGAVDCCNTAALCAILQTLGTQIPGVADTALFVTPAGCFLGVPGGGGGGFPGYGSPVATACANADGVSLLVARADHVHRAAQPVQDEGVLVGTRCTLNFIGLGVTAVDNAGLDRVDITIPGTVFPLLAPDGPCSAPSYAFTSSPDSGMFYDLATGAVIIGDDNCTDFISIGASINIQTTASPVTLNSGGAISAIAATSVTISATAATISIIAATTLALTATASAVLVTAGTIFSVTTGGVLRLDIQAGGAWSIGGSVGAATNVLTSNGAGTPPTWQAAPVTFPGFGTPPANSVDADAATAGVAATALRSDAKLQVLTGTPVATGTANAAGVAAAVARSDHVHRTLVAVQDGGVAVASRPTLNFIDGTNVTVTVADNGGADRIDVTIASNPTLIFSRGATILNPTAAINVITWRAPFAGTVTNVRGYRVGGTGATVNARRNGTDNHLAAAVSIGAADTWVDGGAVQNTAYVAGDKLEIMIVTVTGSPTQVAIQVDFTRTL